MSENNERNDMMLIKLKGIKDDNQSLLVKKETLKEEIELLKDKEYNLKQESRVNKSVLNSSVDDDRKRQQQ